MATSPHATRLERTLDERATSETVDREQLEHELERYRDLFLSAPEAYVLTDADGVVQLANHRAATLFQRSSEELTGTALADLVADEHRDAARRAVPAVVGGSDLHGAELSVQVGQQRHTLLASAVAFPTPDGDTEVRWVFSDAEPAALARRALERLLEDSQGDAASLRVLTEWQATLLGSAAHDIRTPLSVIASTIDTLQTDATTMDPDMLRAMLDRIGRQTKKLRRLIRHLLRSGALQLESGIPNRTTVDLPGMIDEVLHTLSPIGHPVTYAFDTEQLHCDAGQLERVLYELLTHGLQHAPPGTAVRVGTTTHGVDVELFVDDANDTVPVADRAATLAEDRDDDLEGAPPELGLVELFARLHGGRAWVQEAPGGGVSFRVLVSNGRPDSHDEVD